MKIQSLAATLIATMLSLLANAQELAPIRGQPAEKYYNVGGALDLVGSASYSINPATSLVTIAFEELINNSATVTSGPVRVAIIASRAPFAVDKPGTIWTIGIINLQPIAPGYHYTNINTTVPLQAMPPDGVYYIYIAVFEQEAGCTTTGQTLAGYCPDDVSAFPNQRVVIGGVWQPIGTPAPVITTPAVEYYNAAFGHYFVTADPDEIAGLDAGAYNYAFQRTGQTWNVWTTASGPGVDVCRFFTTPGTFGAKSSHFYTADTTECAGLKFNPNWIYEKIAGRVALPVNGVCPAGTQFLYRLYNNGLTGAPNHRYTTSLSVRQQMIGQGFVAEDANTACVPTGGTAPPPTVTTAEGLWEGYTGTSRAAAAVILDDGTYYVLYSTQASDSTIAGVILGTGISSNGSFTSSNARDFNFEGYGVTSGSVSAQFVPKSSMAGTIASPLGTATFTATYNSNYDHPANLAQVAGQYTGQVMVSAGVQTASLSINTAGQISGGGQGCNFTGTATPRGSVNVFNLSVTFGGGNCLFGTSTLYGLAYYAQSGVLYAITPNAARTDGVLFVGHR